MLFPFLSGNTHHRSFMKMKLCILQTIESEGEAHDYFLTSFIIALSLTLRTRFLSFPPGVLFSEKQHFYIYLTTQLDRLGFCFAITHPQQFPFAKNSNSICQFATWEIQNKPISKLIQLKRKIQSHQFFVILPIALILCKRALISDRYRPVFDWNYVHFFLAGFPQMFLIKWFTLAKRVLLSWLFFRN